LFALDVSVWELFTGKLPFDGSRGARQLISKGKTIDVSQIRDEKAFNLVKELMSGMLMKGGTT
jgi:hypothetical protein